MNMKNSFNTSYQVNDEVRLLIHIQRSSQYGD